MLLFPYCCSSFVSSWHLPMRAAGSLRSGFVSPSKLLGSSLHTFEARSQQPPLQGRGTRCMNAAKLHMQDRPSSGRDNKDRTVKAVFTDVDGTLFNSKHSLSEDTKAALLATMKAGIPVIMATGKVVHVYTFSVSQSHKVSPDECCYCRFVSLLLYPISEKKPEIKTFSLHKTSRQQARGSWVGMLRESIGMSPNGWTLNGPGVFIQGLLVCDENGQIVKRTLLDNKVVRRMNTFAEQRGVSVIAYTTGTNP
jgi:hypothetical protein